MEIIIICFGIFALFLIFYTLKTASSSKSSGASFKDSLTNVLSLLHQYDSMSHIAGIERNKYLFMAFHLYLTNILTSREIQTMNIYGSLYIIENGRQKDTTLFHITQVLQPAIQHRIESLPSDVKRDFLRKVYIDDGGVVHTERNLLTDMRTWYEQIDFGTLQQKDYGNDFL